MERLLLRPSEAAEVLGMGRTKVYAMLASGELPSVRIGKSVRIPVEALRRWIQDQTAEQGHLTLAVPLTLSEQNTSRGENPGER